MIRRERRRALQSLIIERFRDDFRAFLVNREKKERPAIIADCRSKPAQALTNENDLMPAMPRHRSKPKKFSLFARSQSDICESLIYDYEAVPGTLRGNQKRVKARRSPRRRERVAQRVKDQNALAATQSAFGKAFCGVAFAARGHSAD